jgi:hypothetical protein
MCSMQTSSLGGELAEEDGAALALPLAAVAELEVAPGAPASGALASALPATNHAAPSNPNK